MATGDRTATEDARRAALIDKLMRHYTAGYKNPFPNLEKSIRESLSIEREEERLDIMRDTFGIDVAHRRILEIGSGSGLFNIACQRRDAECYGVEPDPVKLEVSATLIEEERANRNVLRSVGEKLPFSDGMFDLVASFQVLEHTRVPEEVLQEAARVLKPGGYLYFIVPNYNSFWEGHFGLLWLPRFPRPIAKLYVRVAGRDPAYLDEIQYITPGRMLKALRNENIEVLNLGIETWEKRLESASFSTWGATGVMLRITKLLKRMRVIPLVKYLGRKFSFYYPIMFVARKGVACSPKTGPAMV